MNIKIILIGIILLALSNSATAGYTPTQGSSFDGDGSAVYPNEGVIWARITVDNYAGGSLGYDTPVYAATGHTMNYHFYAEGTACASGADVEVSGWDRLGTAKTLFYISTASSGSCVSGSNTKTIVSSANRYGRVAAFNHGGAWGSGDSGYSFIRVTITEGSIYKISGTTGCLLNVSLYDSADTYLAIDYLSDDTYEFEQLIDGYNYTIKFNNGEEYEFQINGSDIVYNYDACAQTTYNFKESCGNLIPDSEGFYIEKIGDTVHAANYFHTSNGILDISDSPANNVYISAIPFSGQIGWFLDSIVNDTTYNLINPNIAWGLKIIVLNESDGSLIDNAMVKVDQTCYCTSGYSTRQKMTTNGTVDFIDMSLQDASLFVMKPGYKIINENSTGYNVFLSGRMNFSSKTWVVKLAPAWSNNTSTFYEVNNTVNIYFKDVNGNRTSQILDTDSEVYLYYENNNSNDEAMTMRFESSSTHTYFMPEIQWAIPHDEIGHKTIANSYFTPWDYSYRAIIYNSTIYGWNRTIPLTVRNATKETTEHYENLTTYLYFMSASDGRIDYREDMQIGIHVCSNNITLMNVDIELYKNNSLLCYKNMTASDFINADFPYWYMWSPIYDYESGANYSVRMFGFDRTLLETDYVDCITDAITRKNKLTIIVKNRFGTNLDNAFVYLEGYGSLSTGINYYASYEGLDNGYYRYKATKQGYEAAGWDDVTMSDSDEVQIYILTESTSDAATANQPIKADDDELRNLYIMLMSFLLIFILFGGFLYVSK